MQIKLIQLQIEKQDYGPAFFMTSWHVFTLHLNKKDMRTLKIAALLMLAFTIQLKAQTNKTMKDTVMPDTSKVVPIRKAPVDTTRQKMPVVTPQTRDSLSPEMKEMNRKQGQ